MNLSQAFRLSRSSSVALVGAGGKSSALLQLASELSPAVLTTTTHLSQQQISQASRHLVIVEDDPRREILDFDQSGFLAITGPLIAGRFTSVGHDQLTRINSACREKKFPLLIESDGAAQKPVKAPAEHEPAIPGFVDTVVLVAGLSCLGKPLNESSVHRPEIFSRLSGSAIGSMIKTEALIKVLKHPDGGLKNIPAHSRRILLLNQVDTIELRAQGMSLARSLIPTFDCVVTTSFRPHLQIFAATEQIAGIILAAGASSRLGQPKPLMDWYGRSFIQAVVETAVKAGLDPIILVTGAHAGQVKNALHNLPVQIVHNRRWQEGQNTSIRSGMKALLRSVRPQLGAAIFLLVDQPQVPPEVLNALIECHQQTLAPIIAPYIKRKYANPVLFDRITFQALQCINEDMGGRALFSRFPVVNVEWEDERLLIDVDTPEDYVTLRSLYTPH